MNRVVHRLRRRVGHRGAFLLFIMFLDLVSAARLAWPDPGVRTNASYLYLEAIAPLWLWALVWAAVAVVCGWQAFRADDAFAFAAAMILKFGWAAIYLIGWLFFDLPQGYWSVALWTFAALVVYNIATWPEPTSEPAVEAGGGEP